MIETGKDHSKCCQFFSLVAGGLVIFALMALVWSVPPLTGKLPDPDDYLRMERAFALLDGQSMPSYAAPGLGVDAQAETGWSYLVDGPIVAVQSVSELFYDRIPAAMITATIMPALALLCFIFAAAWYSRALVPGWRALPTLLAVLFLWGLLRQFMPGRVDHHMWQAVLAVFAYGALVRLYFSPQRKLYPLIAGGAFGTGLAIGVDVIPALTFGTALLGLFWLVRGRDYERAGLWFGAGLFGVALFWHLTLHDTGRLFAIYCDFLSPAWLALAGAVLAFWGLVYGLPAGFKTGWKSRMLCGGAVFTPLIIGLYVLFPQCFNDPYQISDPVVRDVWLRVVNEAQPFSAIWAESPAAALFFALPPVLALIASFWAMAADKPNRLLWAGLALVFVSALALSFYQIRTIDVAQALSVGPLSWLLVMVARQSGTLARRLALTRGQRLAAASLFFLIALGLFGFALLKRGSETEIAQAQTTEPVCDTRQAAAFLQTLPAPLTIAAYIDIGSELLFRTDHHVLAAPYHRNEAGIMAVYNIFTAQSIEAARAAVKASHTDILMLCDSPESFWTSGAAGQNIFAASLTQGNVPYWLQPVGDAYQTGGYLIFKVK